MIQRDGKASVKANLYVPDNIGDELLPVVFNIHGGGFVGGDADVLDTQSERIANDIIINPYFLPRPQSTL